MNASSPPRSRSSPHLLAASTPIECLRDWVHATHKGTWRRLSAWWTRSDSRVAALSSSHFAGGNSSSIRSAPAPALVAAICALDTDDQPLDCASQHYYTYYDSDEGSTCDDTTSTNTNSKPNREAQLELLQQLAQRDSDDVPLSSDARTGYCKYASHKSGVGA